LLNPA